MRKHEMTISRRRFLKVCGAMGAASIGIPALGAEGEATTGFRFVQMADTQLGMGGYEHDVETFELAVHQINALEPDFVVICGDLVNVPEDKSFADFLRIKAGFTMPCHCVAGNHDVGVAPSPEQLERYRSKIGPDRFVFEHKGFSFVVTNTQLWKSPQCEGAAEHDAWFAQTLRDAASKQSPVIVLGHYPLFIAKADEEEEYFNLPPEKRAELLDLFAECGVVAMLTGHTHRNIVNDHNGIQLITSATTSRNFDGTPMGFRTWRVGDTRPYQHEYIAVEGAKPPDDKQKS